MSNKRDMIQGDLVFCEGELQRKTIELPDFCCFQHIMQVFIVVAHVA
jgi:hypothetical protein